MRAMRIVYGRLRYPFEVVDLEAGDGVEFDGYEVAAFNVRHRGRAFGYAIVEEPRPGRFDAELARAWASSFGPDFGRLQRGEVVNGVAPEQVVGPGRAGRKLVLSGDTRAVRDAARGRPRGRRPRPRGDLHRRGARARAADRALDGAPGGRAGARGRACACSSSPTSPPATPAARSATRRGRRSSAPRSRATSTRRGALPREGRARAAALRRRAGERVSGPPTRGAPACRRARLRRGASGRSAWRWPAPAGSWPACCSSPSWAAPSRSTRSARSPSPSPPQGSAVPALVGQRLDVALDRLRERGPEGRRAGRRALRHRSTRATGRSSTRIPRPARACRRATPSASTSTGHDARAAAGPRRHADRRGARGGGGLRARRPASRPSASRSTRAGWRSTPARARASCGTGPRCARSAAASGSARGRRCGAATRATTKSCGRCASGRRDSAATPGARALGRQGIEDDELAAELGERFGEERRARHETFEDAAPVLDALRGEYRARRS